MDVELIAVKFWRVDEPVVRMLPKDPRPVEVSVVPEIAPDDVMFPPEAVVKNRLVELAVVAKKDVEVEFVVVEFSPVKF